MSTQSPSKPKSPHTARAQKSAKPPKHPNNIRTAIQHSQWNFNQVAEKAKIPRDTLVDYCAGKYAVPHERLQALSEVLNVLPEYLVPPLPDLREAYWSQSQHEETKDLEALLLLRTHCHLHPTDENALQQLMELLGKVGRTREIEKWYERFVQEVKKEDVWREPDADTTTLLARLRARSAPKEEAERPDTGSPVPSPGSPTPPSDPNPQTMGNRNDTIVIQTSQVQIVVQPSSDEETPSGRTIPSVRVTSPDLLDSTPQDGRPPSASSGYLVSSSSQSVNPQGILVVGAVQKLAARNLRDCYLVSSADIVSSLKVYSTRCQGELTTCRQQRDISETIEQRSTMNDEQSQLIDPSQITRRDVFTLVSVSSSLLLNMRRGWPPAGILEEFLSEVTASVTTCWYLLQRSDGLPLVEWAVPQYLPELVEVVKHSSRERKRAAYLAAQGFLLRGLVAHHRTRYAERIEHCQQAVTYAHESGDLTLLVSSLEHLSNALLTNGQLDESLQTYLQAKGYSESAELSGISRSVVRSGLSLVHAKQGKSEQVIQFVDEAYATFAEQDDETPVFLLVDYGRYQLILEEGLSTLDLGNHAKDQGRLSRAREHWINTAETFGKMARLPSGLEVPVRIAAEILLAQALAYAKARNMEGFLTAFTKGVQLTKELGSEKRKQEAREALKEALEQWPNDQRITGLWELL